MLRLVGNMKNRTSIRVVRRTYVDDVALLQLPLVRDSMTNHLVDRTAIIYQIQGFRPLAVEKLLTYKPILGSVDNSWVTDMRYALCRLGVRRHLSHLL